MNLARILPLALILVAAGNVWAKPEKTLVCHVGNKVAPNGDTYLDDPDCTPSLDNDYFCPDAGKVDLVVVPNAENHLENAAHEWAGLFDYEPSEVGATGDGTEDTDGDGIDEGCEPVNTCPCWDSSDLIAITAANQDAFSCDNGSNYPNLALIQNIPESTPGVEGGFVAQIFLSANLGFCSMRDSGEIDSGTPEEFVPCIEQIADRCEAIGSPIRPGG
jgi:hypothetical protein